MVLTGDSQQRAEKPRRAGAGGGAVGRTPSTARSRDADGSRAAVATYRLPIIGSMIRVPTSDVRK